MISSTTIWARAPKPTGASCPPPTTTNTTASSWTTIPIPRPTTTPPRHRQGGRTAFQDFAETWQQIIALKGDAWTETIITEGYQLMWVKDKTIWLSGPQGMHRVPDLPTSLRIPRDSKRNLSRTLRRQATAHLEELVHLGIVSKIKVPMIGGKLPQRYASTTIAFIPKPNGKLRTVYNLRLLSEWVIPSQSRLLRLTEFKAALPTKCFMTSIDLSNAYHAIKVDQQSAKYLTFKFGKQMYSWTTLPQGLNASPAVFIRTISTVLDLFATTWSDVQISPYVDDIALACASKQRLHAATIWLKILLEETGFTINEKKSVLQPKRKLLFLGLLWDGRRNTVSIPVDKRRDLRRQCRKMIATIASKATITPREVARLSGKLQSVCHAVHYGRPHCSEIIAAVTYLKKNADWDSPACLSPTIATSVTEDLEWWHRCLDSKKSSTARCRDPPPSLIVSTDASLFAAGAAVFQIPSEIRHALTTTQAVEIAMTNEPTWRFSEFFTTKMTKMARSIADLELLAIRRCLEARASALRNRRILLLTDSKVALSYIRRQRGRHPHLRSITREIFDLAEKNNITIARSEYIGTKENHVADKLSRRIDNDDWKLDPEIFKKACAHFNLRPTMDVFASATNKQLPRFCSAQVSDDSCGNGARIRWDPISWANPPFSLLPHLPELIRRNHQTTLLTLLPVWPFRPWFTTLRNMMIAEPLWFPTSTTMFSAGNKGSDCFHLRTRWPVMIAPIAARAEQ